MPDKLVVAIPYKHLNTFYTVCLEGSIKKASDTLHRSRSTIAYALDELESAFQVNLFERSTHGVLETVFGNTLRLRAHYAFNEMHMARKALNEIATANAIRLHNSPVFTLGVSARKLQALLAFAQFKHMGAVANRLAVSQPAVSMAIRELDLSTGLPLFERSGHNVRLTRAGEILLSHLRRALVQVRLALDDIAMLKGEIKGSIKVGALPYGGGSILPEAIAQLLQHHPQLKVTTTLGPFHRLISALWHGDIDLVVGALQPADPYPDLVSEQLFNDPIRILARKGHPLLQKPAPGWSELAHEGWILPRSGSPTRQAVENRLLALGLPPPLVQVESSDPSTTRGLLLASNLITAAAEPMFMHELQLGSLQALAVDTSGMVRSIGILTRSEEHSSPAAQLLIQEIRKTATGRRTESSLHKSIAPNVAPQQII